MAKLNQTVCAIDIANTGVGDCPLIPKHITGMFIVPKDFRLEPSDFDNLQEVLQDLAEDSNPSDRILPIHGFVGIEDNTEDLEVETLGYGGLAPIREGRYDLTFRMGQGGVCLLRSLRKLNGRSLRVLLYDADGVLFGAQDGSDMVGIPLEMFYALPMTLSDGSSTTTSFNVRLVFDASYLNDSLAFVETKTDGFLLQEISGLLDIYFMQAPGSSNPVILLTGSASCGSQNVLQEFSSELGDVGMWVATSAEDGSSVDITSVSINSEGVATITLDAAEDVIINLVDVDALSSAGVKGYEGRPIRVAE